MEKEAPTNSPPAISKDGKTKTDFRNKVWSYLEDNNLAVFPRPVFGKIPNFKGADVAGKKLLDLNIFKEAQFVEINPDKPLATCRQLTLENDKTLYVPVPRLKDNFLKHLSKVRGYRIKTVISRFGMERLGEVLSFDASIKIDLVVMGSVAVSKQGYRIGKGKGYADLEFAILKEMGAITDETPLVTVVHDCQVFDELPSDIFKKHDVPIDYIITPTQVIEIEKKLPKPDGIYWKLLTRKQVASMAILGHLREKHLAMNKDVTLRGANHSRQFSRKKGPKKTEIIVKAITPKENKKMVNNNNKRRIRHNYDFSVRISNIEKNVRCRTFKEVLTEKGIRPAVITWHGFRGFCYLHYGNSYQLDNVLEALKNLNINAISKKNLNVKVMEPITRIETTDVTAV